MRKTAATVTVTTLILGIFGAFFRWLQKHNAFEKETGYPIPFHGTTIVFLIYCVLAIAFIAALCFVWLRRYSCNKDVSALRCSTHVPAVLSWIFGVGFALGAAVVLFFSDYGTYPTMQRIFGAFGIIGGLCFPFLIAKTDGHARSFGAAAASAADIFACYALVFCYRSHSMDPIIGGYAVEILAVAAAAAALYYVAAFHYGAARGSRALFAVQLGVFFCVSTLFDGHSNPVSVMFLCMTGMLLLTEFLLLENLQDSGVE